MKYDHYEKILNNSEYLEDLTEDVIYSSLTDAIRIHHTTPFNDFN